MRFDRLNRELNLAAFVGRPQFSLTRTQTPTTLPKISIITPSYNQGNFLERTILSVLNQNYPNLEFIIIDGGSSDNSVDIIRRYEKHLTYWSSEKDRGQSDAIRKGFEKATGKIFAWLNSDDCYLPGTLHRVAEGFRQSGGDFVYGDEYLIDEHDRIINIRPQLPYPRWVGPAFFVYGGFWIFQPASFWTAALYRRVAGINPSYHFAMDNDLFVQFALAKARFYYCGHPVTAFRIHGASKTCTISHVGIQEADGLTAKYGHLIPRILRSRFVTRNLGRLYTFRYLASGQAAYLVDFYKYKIAQKLRPRIEPRYF